jgi:hypothetical protein
VNIGGSEFLTGVQITPASPVSPATAKVHRQTRPSPRR